MAHLTNGPHQPSNHAAGPPSAQGTAVMIPSSCPRGPLISIEGITGIGKTYLASRAAETLNPQPLLLDGFSRRAPQHPGLGSALLTALREASGNDPFLRGGTPVAEALLLAAIKRHDLDTILPTLAGGQAVIEGRSIDTTAVCQALQLHPRTPAAALDEAIALLRLAAAFRPLPDLTILIIGDPATAIQRAEQRDQRVFTSEQARFLNQASKLFEQLAATSPERYRVIDRRSTSAHHAIRQIRVWIEEARTGLNCVREPWRGPAAPCLYCGHHSGQVLL